MKKLGLNFCFLLPNFIFLALCGCDKTLDSTDDMNSVISITTNPSPVGDIMMGNSFTITASTDHANNQIITASSSLNVTFSPSASCSFGSGHGPSTCTITVTPTWDTTQATGQNISTYINLSVAGTALTPVAYTFQTPMAYLPKIGTTTADGNAGVAWPNPRFTVAGNCMIDNLTGLMWLKNGNYSSAFFANPTSYDNTNDPNAFQDITNLNANGGACGFTDWRLPTINELSTLINMNATPVTFSAYLNNQGFTNVQAASYFSSSSANSLLGNAWAIVLDDYTSFDTGRVTPLPQGNTNFILPVRDGQSPAPSHVFNVDPDTNPPNSNVVWPNPRFTNLDGGCDIQDNLTGLIWKATSSNCGHSDWRAPNITELRSLVNYGYTGQPSDYLTANGFQIIDGVSSTTGQFATGNLWVLLFNIGFTVEEGIVSPSSWVRGGE